MYTIQLLKAKGSLAFASHISRALNDRLASSPFVATIRVGMGSKDRSCVLLKPVRLRARKPYCGNHPGPCEVLGARKKNATYLEWDDWVAFHEIVNATLDVLGVEADVWSTPTDVQGKMWIRRGNKPRVRWDWEETYNSMGRAVRIWNTGTPDQFAQDLPARWVFANEAEREGIEAEV